VTADRHRALISQHRTSTRPVFTDSHLGARMWACTKDAWQGAPASSPVQTQSAVEVGDGAGIEEAHRAEYVGVDPIEGSVDAALPPPRPGRSGRRARPSLRRARRDHLYEVAAARRLLSQRMSVHPPTRRRLSDERDARQ
jgi:hypothetical protein